MSNISQWSTSAASNNAAPPDGMPEGQAPSTVNDSVREIMAAVAKLYTDTDGTLVTAGAGNAYTLTTNNVHAALADQSLIIVRMDRANTGAATLDVDGLGAKAIEIAGAAISSGEIVADSALALSYNATNDAYDILNSFSASGRTLTAGSGMTGGGTLDADRTFDVIGGNGITANADDIELTDAAATTTNPVDVASGVVSLDVEALTTIEGSALAATDTFYVEDGGVSKGMEVQAMGLRVQTAQTTQTLAAADMNSIMEFDATSTLTIDENATVDLPLGVPVVIVVDHATQEVTIQADTSVTLNSINHPGGTANASDTVIAGGTALLFQLTTDNWYLTGDISD